MNNLSTKEKILHCAKDLFATHGYEGTSIRDISKTACVNLSAINYHFKNKENLYCEVFDSNYTGLEKKIKDLDDEKISIQDFAWKLFQLFLTNESAFINIFKIILTNSVEIPAEYKKEGESFGPPGHNTLLNVISRQIDETTPLEAKRWATDIIFIHVAHSAIMMSSSIIKDQCEKYNAYPEQMIKQNITYLADSTIEHIVNHPDKWSN